MTAAETACSKLDCNASQTALLRDPQNQHCQLSNPTSSPILAIAVELSRSLRHRSAAAMLCDICSETHRGITPPCKLASHKMTKKGALEYTTSYRPRLCSYYDYSWKNNVPALAYRNRIIWPHCTKLRELDGVGITNPIAKIALMPKKNSSVGLSVLHTN